jgi:hypothetical protein
MIAVSAVSYLIAGALLLTFGIGYVVGIAVVMRDTELWPFVCRKCGCTEDRACPGGCWWAAPGLCSSCAGVPA